MKKKKNSLLKSIINGDKHKHRVAMVNEEAEWNQHEPNSGMARMFFVMLLIHVIVIGGIIIYDWLSGDEAAPSSIIASSQTPSALPPPAVSAAQVAERPSIEDCATYAWTSGDSLASVAAKLNTTEEMLIKLNLLDKGTQLEPNSIIFYPKQPVVKAVGVSVAGVNGELAQPAIPSNSLALSQAPLSLTAPGEQTFSFQPTIENELAPTPGASPSTNIVTPSVQNNPPAGQMQGATGSSPDVSSAEKKVVETPPAAVVKKETPKVQEAPPARSEPKVVAKKEEEVPKAIPINRYTPPTLNERAPAPVKKKVTEPAPAASKSKFHTVRPGETLYSIASRNGTTVKALQAANKISKPEALRDGMKLVIPAR